MTEKQWSNLLDILNGKELKPLPVGFIIDSPWLPNWYGIKILDYFTNDDLWFNANKHVSEVFPDVLFLPGFWSEYGMCSEPSVFGARCTFPPNEFPHAHKTIHSVEDISKIIKPNPETDGFAPFILNRLLLNQKKVEDIGHNIYFSVSRGPLNVASYLMGVTEFLLAMMTNPEETHQLLTIINDYLIEWHDLQQQRLPSIDGMLVLDDIIGFIGEEEFKVFGLPYLKKLFDRNVTVKFLHNDADCSSSIKYLPEIGINLYNMGFDKTLNDLIELTNGHVTMLGNIPPRDVLANGSRDDIERTVNDLIGSLNNRTEVILSCGGGMPPGVPTENITHFTEMVKKYS
ncbi:MAG: uroporphyrinogen decarboxylase [Bacteroides sp. SM23_62_1]|nr:MAG: uroporphyrinogen decarboxylase [Bacteroides sp. SM23_62_1]